MTTHSEAKILPFDPARRRKPDAPVTVQSDERQVVAAVTVTRFIDGAKVHVQVPIYADEIHCASRADLKVVPELSELLADGAVEANSYLDRLSAAAAARPVNAF